MASSYTSLSSSWANLLFLFILLELAIIPAHAISPHYRQETPAKFAKRATPEAPDGYAPRALACPDELPTIRNADSLSDNETEWLRTRRPATVDAMRTLLPRLNITGFNANAYIERYASSNISQLPNIALAFSGGGYRALMNAGGALAAFDDRTAHNSTAAGALAGLLQAATYVSGLSGGSWLVGSIYVNNFTSVQKILDDDTSSSSSGSLWQFGDTIFEGPSDGSLPVVSTAGYYNTIEDQVKAKDDAGFETSITDYWGRALSFQLINASSGGPAYTYSSIADADWFRNGSVPLPLIVADGRSPGEVIISGNSTIYEVNPWEFGSWDPTTHAFAPTRYLGTNFSAGAVVDEDACVRGYDNAGYVYGTSSTLFNQFLLQINSISGVPEVLRSALTSVLARVGESDNDIAQWSNPFIGYNNDTSRIANETTLDLVDGGEDLQNIPLWPVYQPDRHVDVIFAIDSSADTDTSTPAPNWPNGTSLVATYERQFLDIANGTSFPSIPDVQTFVNLGLNNRPTFFGCNSSNLTSPAPLIVYLPNAPYSFNSNISTFEAEYNDTTRNAIINNGYNVATMGNGSVDSTWPTCVGCAILSRSLERTRTAVPAVCRQCFETFCWDGSLNTTQNAYTPSSKLQSINVDSAAAGRLPSGLALGGKTLVGAALALFLSSVV